MQSQSQSQSQSQPPAAPARPIEVAPARPLAAVLAVVLLIVVGLGTIAFGALVLLLGTEVRAGTTESTAVALTGGFAVVFGIASFLAAAGTWSGRGWGWVLALVVALVGLLGIGVSIAYSGLQAPLLAGLGLFGAVLACLLVPGVRSRAGIG